MSKRTSQHKAGALVLSLLLAMPPAPLSAQILNGLGDLPADQRAQPLPDDLEPPSAIDRRTGTYGPVVTSAFEEDRIPVFGADLFTGGFRGPRGAGLNPSYRILPGDQITLRVWGAVEIDRVLPVDAQGNIFIPYVGPVQVQGISNGELNSRVRSAIRQVFTDNVSVYTNLQGVQPVAVFVTGYVQKPGRYAGSPNDSLLYFLDQAAGIDQATGSFRRVRVIRDGKTIAEADLYEFLISGKIPRPQFQDGDTIVVQIEGSYEGPSRFAVPKDATLKELLDSIPVNPALTDVRSVSLRRLSVAQRQKQSLEDALRRLETTYLGASSQTDEEARIRIQEAKLIQDFVARARQIEPNGRMVVAYDGRIADVRLQDGDIITIPERSDNVLISGEVLMPQAMVFVDGERVSDYIKRAGGFSERADEDNILIVRQNGEVVTALDAALRPGDEILVLPEVPSKNLQLTSAVAQILFQIAVATKTILDL